MKKIILLAMSVAMLFCFVGCSKKDDSNVIKIGTSPDYTPYEFYDDNGKMTGFDIEAMEEIANIMTTNGEKTDIEWVAMDFATIISAVQTGQVDLGVACFTYDPDRDVLFSDNYLTSSQRVVVIKDSKIETIADLEGKRIVAGEGTTGQEAAQKIKDAKVSSPGDHTVMFEFLANNGCDAVVCDEAVALNYESTGNYKVLTEKLVDEKVSVIADKNNNEIIEKVNKAINEFVESEKYNELKEKYKLI